MKVIHFIRSIDKTAGGTTAYIKLLTENLNGKLEQILVTAYSSNPVQLKDVPIQFYQMSLKRWWRLKREFTEFLEENKPDLVHINAIWNPENSLFQQCAQNLGIKIILSPHGMLEPYILNRHKWKKKLALSLYQDKALRKADYIHTTANSELNQIRKLRYQQKSWVVPNGIDITEVLPKTVFRKNNDPLKLLFLSRIHPKKGIDLLLKALAKVRDKNIILKIAGNGEDLYIKYLKDLSNNLNLTDQVEFVGPVYGHTKWKLYQTCDVFILPTYSENFGIVVTEALATGIPVITTTGTPWSELIKKKCGWWIELGIDNLIKTIKEAMSKTGEELEIMGKNGQELVKNKYDINSVANKFLSIYQSIIQENSTK